MEAGLEVGCCSSCLPDFVAASGSFARGQAAGRKDDAPLRVSTQLVLVPALVREKSGALVYTLSAKDFVLTDDGVPQKVTAGAGHRRRTAGACGGDGGRRGASSRLDGIRRIATSLRTGSGIFRRWWRESSAIVPKKIAVVEFDSRVQTVEDFTPNMDAVESALVDASEDENSDGGAAILDGLGFAVEMLKKQPTSYRRAILLLSETNDRGSQLPLAQTIRAISDTNTTIFSVAFSSGKAAASEYGHKWLPTKEAKTPR